MYYNIKDKLNELKWDKKKHLNLVTIHYTSRGEPNDTGILEGSDITGIGKWYVILAEGVVPYHRINKIYYKDKVIFDRKKIKEKHL